MTDSDLPNYLVRVLLRYFRKGGAQTVESAAVHESDRELLLLQWAASEQVRELCLYLSQHPHEVRAVLRPKTVVGRGSIRGRVRAAESVAMQERTADGSAVVYDEPFRSFDGGPNRVLGWTLKYAMQIASRFRSLLPPEATYRNRVADRLRLLQDVRRLMPFASTPVTVPTAGDLRAARASRLELYRKAAISYDFLRSVERLDEISLKDLLMRSLVGPLDRWRQFELALALAMASAISPKINAEVILRRILPGSADSIIDVGPYAIRWQQAGPLFSGVTLAAWEAVESEIIREYGLSPGYERPDVVLFDRRSNLVVSIGEAKYFERDDWRDRLRDAVSQIVTYARGYEAVQDVDGIIGRSIIALWSAEDEAPRPMTQLSPWVTTFAEMRAGLGGWANRALV